MRVVIADTGPLHYMILIGHVEILPALFERLFIPSALRNELMHLEAPLIIRQWISQPPQGACCGRRGRKLERLDRTPSPSWCECTGHSGLILVLVREGRMDLG